MPLNCTIGIELSERLMLHRCIVTEEKPKYIGANIGRWVDVGMELVEVPF